MKYITPLITFAIGFILGLSVMELLSMTLVMM